MKVVFVKNVPNVGQINQVKEVSDGYALNFLLPRQLAVPATKQALQLSSLNEAKKFKQASEQAKLLVDLKQRLSGLAVNLKAKASPSGTLYAAVSEQQVKQAVFKTSGLNLEQVKILDCHNIKSLGAHSLKVRLPSNQTVDLKVIIEAL